MLNMNHAYDRAVEELFSTYRFGTDIDSVLDPPQPGKKLSFCPSDTVVIDPSLCRHFLEERLSSPLDKQKLALAFLRIGQQYFLSQRPYILRLTTQWQQFFSGLSYD